MVSSWTEFVSGYKSRLSALARSCFLRRRHWQQKYLETKQALREAQALLARCEARCQPWEQQPPAAVQPVATLPSQLVEPRPVLLPVGETPPGQQYGANQIALAVNLGRRLGVRPARHAMKSFSRG